MHSVQASPVILLLELLISFHRMFTDCNEAIYIYMYLFTLQVSRKSLMDDDSDDADDDDSEIDSDLASVESRSVTDDDQYDFVDEDREGD